MEAALGCLVAWMALVIVVFGIGFDYFDSPFFSFGPSNDLYIVGIKYYVNTWPRYCCIISYITIQNFIVTFTGDNLYPWINAVVLNRQQPTLTMSKKKAFALTNIMYATFSILGLFSIGITMSQFDFWLFGFASTTLAGMIQSYRCIKDKQVVIPSIESVEELL